MTRPILRVPIQEILANGRLPGIQLPCICSGARSGEIFDGGEETTIKARGTRQDTPTRRTHPAMSKGLVRGLTLAAFAAFGTMTCVASAGAAELIRSCTTLGTPDKTYALTEDLFSCGTTCLTVSADRITIDLKGHTISPDCPRVEEGRLAETDAAVGEEPMPIAGVTDGEIQRLGTTVKNGTIQGLRGWRFSRLERGQRHPKSRGIRQYRLRPQPRRSQPREGLLDRAQRPVWHPHW